VAQGGALLGLDLGSGSAITPSLTFENAPASLEEEEAVQGDSTSKGTDP
jgi:hypothetical protein